MDIVVMVSQKCLWYNHGQSGDDYHGNVCDIIIDRLVMNNYHGKVCDGNQKVIAIVEMFVIICSDGGYHGNVCDVNYGHNNINDHGNVRDDNHGHRRDGIVS